ncbi:39S ribosomal protein L17, mitochondrial isoform X2 [Harpegnathos saltator]|uniref:Large ribosomal subunit protein bL17m n=1 Tax=Harpegnathos saltator TaxID=610380 RepID=E2BLJ2_HARSA|nr:39S ribosomal protein L17, mitochondrial isoform X2 [Harpegnathos saltator]EFN83429.1 39S ribosomal protein L17, mitochondrial [Harpegnathos saltator]
MNQANVEKLVNKLRFNVKPNPRRMRNIDGPEGRLRKIQKTLTALIKYERIELNYNRADETRGYVEQLIHEAIRNGPTHKETMDMANFWIAEKQLVHKLFKVLVPRYQDYTISFTKLHKAPKNYPGSPYERAVLEFKAKKEYRMEKYQEVAENIK